MQGETMTRTMFPKAVTFLLPLALSGAAVAQMPQMESHAAACTAPVAPSAELAPWASPAPLTASGNARRPAPLALGQAAAVTLLPTPQVTYPLRPEKPGGSVSYGGLIGFEVKQAATYRVALSSGAWIDVVRGGKAVTSVAHGHGPDCTGVRKMVDFPLTPGRYTLQLAANGAPQMTVLIARLP